MLFRALRPVVIAPGLVIQRHEIASCPDAEAYPLLAAKAIQPCVRARVATDGVVVGRITCSAGQVVDLNSFMNPDGYGYTRFDERFRKQLASSFKSTIPVIPTGQSRPIEVGVLEAYAMVFAGQARYAVPAAVLGYWFD